MSKITTCLWFDGKAEEAARFYVSLLPNSRIDKIICYSMPMPGGAPGDVMLVTFTLAGRDYMALNGGPIHQFTPAVSFCISCADQAEIDRLWKALCDGGAPGRCGWLKDRYGVSWQVVPAAIGEMMTSKDAAKIRRMTEAMLPMSKIDVAALRNAFDGGSAA